MRPFLLQCMSRLQSLQWCIACAFFTKGKAHCVRDYILPFAFCLLPSQPGSGMNLRLWGAATAFPSLGAPKTGLSIGTKYFMAEPS